MGSGLESLPPAKTLVVDVLDRIARQCSVDAPSSWLTTTEEDHKAIRDDFLPETVDDILERVDLPRSSSVALFSVDTILGDGSETYSLNSDFKRLQRDQFAVYERSNNRRPCIPVPDDGMWTHIKQLGTAGVERFYRLTGYEGNWSISFYRPLETGDAVVVHYVSDRWIVGADGDRASSFTDAGDTLMLPRRLVETGTVLRFRKRNGLPYDDYRMEYEALMNRANNDQNTRRVIHFGEGGNRVAPWDIPIPDYIPPSS